MCISDRHHRAIRGKGWGFIQRAGREHASARATGAAIHQGDAIDVAGTLRGGELLAIKRQRRTGVVAAIKGHAAGTAATGRDLIDLRPPTPVGGEVQTLSLIHI